MIKLVKSAFFIIAQFLFLQGIYAQNQVNISDYIKQQFLRYCEEVPREEVYIHSDRNEYIAGEDLWLNVYLMDRQNGTPSLSSQIAYVELLNRENRPVAQRRIKTDNGFGPGHLVIPDTLSSGKYTIRAYTSWMKNFLPDNCFMKDINIYNAFSKNGFIGKLSTDNTNIESNERFPDIEEVTLNVDNSKPDILEIMINAGGTFIRDNSAVLLFIQTHGKINHVSTELLSQQNTKISINKEELIPGINHITIFSLNGKPLRERFIYTPSQETHFTNLNPPEIVKAKNKVSLEFTIDDSHNNQLHPANLSISVSPRLKYTGTPGINDYMVFGSEFGITPWNILRGRKISSLPADVIDSLLLNLKSNWITWEKVLSDDLPVLKYKSETETHYLSGSLINRNSSAIDSARYIFMSTPGKEAVFQYARTDGDGDFSFRIQIDDRYKDLIIQPADPGSNYSIKINSSFSENYLLSETLEEPLSPETQSYVSKMSVNYQVSKIYEASYAVVSDNQMFPDLKNKRFYGKPDIELIMADYIKLPVMEEVFFELIPGAFMKNRRSVYEITIMDPVENKIYETPPCLMIDGVIINDHSIIANLDPEDVEQIDVVKERYFVGDYMFYGIVNVITKDGDFSYVDLPEYATRLRYRVIDPASSFVSPDYTSEEIRSSRIPDFRNTLYWDPSVKPDKDGKARIEFWSSDICSEYEINIQGISQDGKLISYSGILKVE